MDEQARGSRSGSAARDGQGKGRWLRLVLYPGHRPSTGATSTRDPGGIGLPLACFSLVRGIRQS
jgi:hypothetical protein